MPLLLGRTLPRCLVGRGGNHLFLCLLGKDGLVRINSLDVDIDGTDGITRVTLQVGLDLLLDVPGQIGNTLPVFDQDVGLYGYGGDLPLLDGDSNSLAGLAANLDAMPVFVVWILGMPWIVFRVSSTITSSEIWTLPSKRAPGEALTSLTFS